MQQRLRNVLAIAALLVLGACASTGDLPPAPIVAADADLIAETVQQSLEQDRTGESRNWSSAESGQIGTVTPTRTYALDDGSPCREYPRRAGKTPGI